MAVRCGTASRYERVRLPSALTHAVVCVASTSSSQRYGSATVVPKYVSVTVPRGAAGYVTPAASAGAANSRATTAKTTRRKAGLLGSVVRRAAPARRERTLRGARDRWNGRGRGRVRR